MSVYLVKYRSGIVKGGYERSPRIAVESDAGSATELPAAVQDAGDFLCLGTLRTLRDNRLPPDCNGAISWFAGDRLTSGSAAILRRALRTPGRRTFVPVHFPCRTELDLLALAPCCLAAGPMKDYIDRDLRIAGNANPSDEVRSALSAVNQPWAQILQALLKEAAGAGGGVETLRKLYQDKSTPRVFAALALRNLIAVLIRDKELGQAEQLIQSGLQTYPGYAELSYMAAVLCVLQQKSGAAFAHLERAKVENREYIGGGGEGSYRAGWLLGVLAVRVGNQRVAFDHFLPGLLQQPAFAPAVNELLNLRLSPSLVEARQWDLCALVRREPQYLEAVFDYLLLHRAFPAARRIVETMPYTEDQQAALRQKLEAASAPFRPGARPGANHPGVMLCGPFLEHSSLARINRELGVALLETAGFDACLEPTCHPSLSREAVPRGELLSAGMLRHPRRLDLTIRLRWPPDLRRPETGKLAVNLPWEYGAIPRVWGKLIEENVDELWVPSRFVREVFLRGGAGEQRVQVIPYGIDPALFRPEGGTIRPLGCRGFMFLFVGGPILRKGLDVLLEAYGEAFSSEDDVTLVVSAGSNPAYAHNSLNSLLAKFAGEPRAPHLITLTETLDDETLASLYRGCDAFVAPYRGEGFGMPMVEAMACGKPGITTALGPSADYCSAETAYLISAKEVEVPDDLPPFGPMAGAFTWFEPDTGELARTMAEVYRQPEEAGKRGRAAARVVREKLSWPRVTQLYRERIELLVKG